MKCCGLHWPFVPKKYLIQWWSNNWEKSHPLPKKIFFFRILRPFEATKVHEWPWLHSTWSERLKNIHHVGFYLIKYCGLHWKTTWPWMNQVSQKANKICGWTQWCKFEAIRCHQSSGMAKMSKQIHCMFSERIKNIHHFGFNLIKYCGLHGGQTGLWWTTLTIYLSEVPKAYLM